MTKAEHLHGENVLDKKKNINEYYKLVKQNSNGNIITRTTEKGEKKKRTR